MRPQPADGFEWIETPDGPALTCRGLLPFARHFFTTRDWRLGSPSATAADLQAAWADVARGLDVGPASLARLRQVHGAAVVEARCGDMPAADRLDEADILIANDSGCGLAIQTADCVPILLADTRSGAVAAAHAGWRGLAARVPYAVVTALSERFGSRPADLVCAVGPSISAARYEVGRDVRDAFESAGFDRDRLGIWFPVETRREHWRFDGWASARDQLEAAGVPPARIHVARLCTATYPDLFCSYRRDGKRAGRTAAAIKSLKSEV